MATIIQRKEELGVAQDRLAAANFTFINAESRLLNATATRDRLQASYIQALRDFICRRQLPVLIASDEAKEALSAALNLTRHVIQLAEQGAMEARTATAEVPSSLMKALEKLEQLQKLTGMRSPSLESNIGQCVSYLNAATIIALLDVAETKWMAVLDMLKGIAKYLESTLSELEIELENYAANLERAEDATLVDEQEEKYRLERFRL